MREEGGTPAIVESIRAGLVMKLKMSVGVEFIMKREESLRKMFMSKFQINDRMLILGHNNPTQLPIFSFLIRHPETGLYLHHNYVVALLNDLFGIQVVQLFCLFAINLLDAWDYEIYNFKFRLEEVARVRDRTSSLYLA